MTILQTPDSLSLSSIIKDIRVSSTTDVSFTLSHGEEEVISLKYTPDSEGIIEIQLRELVHDRLSYLLQDSGSVYEQTTLVGDFRATVDDLSFTFRVLRGGVENLSETVSNFLMQNFLTWQPTTKKVTYSSPEFLTYYTQTACEVKLKAYFMENGVVSNETITYAQLSSGKAYTIPLQYALVSGRFDSRLPSYYDVWIENSASERLTYIQRYQADDAKSLHEDWILFENSLGGLDVFRAYGVDMMTATHTHNIAEYDEESYEYSVDTERKHKKNTGYLQPSEARWLLDFFPSTKKYIYIDNTIRSIVVTDSEVKRDNKLLPTGYAFTYKFANARPLLNLPRTEVPATMLDIQVPDLGSFPTPPRLAEFPRLPLTEGALIPIQSPYSEEWNTTSVSAMTAFMAALLGLNDTRKLENCRGIWSAEVAASDNPYKATDTSFDSVWHKGCRWQCLVSGTLQEPSFLSSDWALLEGDPNLYLDFTSTNGWQFFRSQVDTVITAIVTHANQDITESVLSKEGTSIVWTRDSGNVPLDNTWVPTYVDGHKHIIHLSVSDMGVDWGYSVRKVKFTCTVYIQDGDNYSTAENSITI